MLMDELMDEQSPERGGVIGYVAAIFFQLLVFGGAVIAWRWLYFQTGERCGDWCDYAGVSYANYVFFGVSAIAFIASISAAIIGWRTAKDLLWIPFASCALIVGGYFLGAMIYDSATGG